MKLVKKTIEYKGRHYPAVEAILGRADWNKVGRIVKEPLLFATSELLDNMGIDIVDGEGAKIDETICAYPANNQCEHFHEGAISAAEFSGYVRWTIRNNYGRINNSGAQSSK